MQYDNEQYPYQPYQEPPKSYPETIISNILLSVVCIFLLVVGFLAVIMLTSTIDNQSGVQFTTYSQSFDITDPLSTQYVYTSNPLLSNIVVTKYNATNASYGGVPSTSYTYDDDYAYIRINSGLEHTITSVLVTADTDYTEVPAESVFSAFGLGLIVLAIMGFFGIVGFKLLNR